jgi:hypothetical protein
MIAPEDGILHTETKHKISEAAEILLEAHYGLIDSKGVIFRRTGQSEFFVRTEDGTFRVTVSTKLRPVNMKTK